MSCEMADLSNPALPKAVRPTLIVAGAVGLLIGGTLVLWANYGSTVFFEMIAAGIAACF